MKNILRCLFILVTTIICLALFACTKSPTFEDITIIGEDIENLEEGTHTLRYKIENLEEYQKIHNVTIDVIVTDENNGLVQLSNQKVMQIVKDKEYLVTIMVSADNGNKTKIHSYTLKAIKSPVLIVFTSQHDNFDNILKSVPYGGTLKDIPDVPDYSPPDQEGYTITVTKKGWSREDFTNLTSNIIVNAVYSISANKNKYSISFNTNGGNIIDNISVSFNDRINLPPNPTKDNNIFFGWYTDESLQTKFTSEKMASNNLTLYARWVTPITNATDESFFNFELNTAGGYTISAKNKNNMPETVIVPNIYNDKLVTWIKGFSQCSQIKTLHLPETIYVIDSLCFSGEGLDSSIVEMNLETVHIDSRSNLSVISKKAFSHCTKLSSITLPSEITTIDDKAFYNCQNLTNLEFIQDTNLFEICESAFENCISLTVLILPESLSIIRRKAFYNCLALEKISLLPSIPPQIASNSFTKEGEQEPNITFYVADVELYKAISFFNIYDVLSLDDF